MALEDRRDLTVAVWWEILLARLNLILDCSNPTDQDEGIEPTNKAILALLWASPSRVREAYLEALNENSAITPALIIECLNAHFFEVAVLLLSKVSSISPQTIEQLFTIENRHKILELARTIRIPNIILVDFMNAAENNFIDQGELLRRAA